MCDFGIVSIPLAMAAVGAASAAVQAKNARDVAKSNSASAAENANNMYAQINEKQDEINSQSSDDATDRNKQAMKETGTLNAAFAESGLTGNSQQRLIDEVGSSNNRDQATIEKNRNNAIKQTKQEANGVQANTQSTMNNNRTNSALGVGLQIGTAAFNGYASGGGFNKKG